MQSQDISKKLGKLIFLSSFINCNFKLKVHFIYFLINKFDRKETIAKKTMKIRENYRLTMF
jgi:hypothetical protein